MILFDFVNRQNWRRTKEEFSTSTQEGYRSANTIRIPRLSGPRLIQIHTSFSGVHPASILAQQSSQESKYSLELTAGSNPAMTGLPMDPASPRHSSLWTPYHPDTASYGPRITPTQSSTERPATKSATYPPTTIGRMLTRCIQPAKHKSTRKQDSNTKN